MEDIINKWAVKALYSDPIRELTKRLVNVANDLEYVQTDLAGRGAVDLALQTIRGASSEWLLSTALDHAADTLVFCKQTPQQRLAAEADIDAGWREASKGQQ